MKKSVMEAIEGSWPVLPKERTWNTWGFAAIAISAGVAAWGYIIGGYVAYYLNAYMGTLAMIAGSLVGMYWVVLATIPVSNRYGIDTITASRPQLGVRGVYCAIFLQYTCIAGWNCLLLILLGRAMGHIAVAAGWASASHTGLISGVGSVSATGVAWMVLLRGADAIRRHAYVISILIFTLSAWILYQLIRSVGLSALFNAVPSASSGDRLWDYVVGFEILVAAVLSWWPYMGGMVRLVPNARQASWPAMLCMGLPIGVISAIGLYAGLVFGNADPTVWLMHLGGVAHGISALVLLGAANIGAAVVGAYVAGIGLRQIPCFQNRLNWTWTTFVVLLPVMLISGFIPDFFFEHTGTFLAFLGVFFGPLVGIQVTDYFLLRKGRLNLRGLYDNRPHSAYYFTGGINPAAITALVIGFMIYVYLLNPVTFVSRGCFKYTSASLPAIFTASVVYYMLSRWYVQKSGLGDYGNP